METSTKPVVLGYDGSREADGALREAVELSRRHEWPLRIVVARGDLHRLSAWADGWTHGLAEEWAQLAAKRLAELGATATEIDIRDGLAVPVLVEESATAACVVVGALGHGVVVGRLQGSVSQHVSRHATCPVLVVRDGSAPEGPVVVGVDGSAASLQALEFALHEAGLRECRLDVLYAPQRINGYGVGDPGGVGVAVDLLRVLRAHDEQVLEQVAAVIAKHPGVDVAVRTVDGSPARELVRASKEAALVVVGSRGAGAFEGLLLGSVSAAVLRRARCPVAVVR